ncbi:MAG: hypothetical protein ACFBRM_06220 [Pikeienuella sp.]
MLAKILTLHPSQPALAAVAACLILSGCLLAERPEPKPEAAPDFSHLREPGCYTVDLFREVPIQPADGLPQEFARYLGAWGNGVWNGSWCHDLLIHTVHADGRVELLDMHAPSEEFRKPASVFKRTGQIREDGALHFTHGIVARRYEIREGLMFGRAEGGAFGEADIVLSRKGVVPLPVPRPVQIARGPVAEPGVPSVAAVPAFGSAPIPPERALQP